MLKIVVAEVPLLSLPVVCLSIDIGDVRRKIASLEDDGRSIDSIVIACATETEKRWLEREYAFGKQKDGTNWMFLVREELKRFLDHSVYLAPIWKQWSIPLMTG